MPSTSTLLDVMTRARSFLNDAGAQIWTDTKLLPHAQTAYSWLANQFSLFDELANQKVTGQPFTPSDLVYTQGATDLTSIVPADVWFPTRLEFRELATDDWTEVDPVAQLQTTVALRTGVPRGWMWRMRTIFVDPVNNGGFIRLTYVSLIPPTATDATTTVLIDNAVEALAYYAAGSAYSSRGQLNQAAAMFGSDTEGNPLYLTGASGFAKMLLDLLIKVRQDIPTRGRQFDTGTTGIGSYGPLLY